MYTTPSAASSAYVQQTDVFWTDASRPLRCCKTTFYQSFRQGEAFNKRVPVSGSTRVVASDRAKRKLGYSAPTLIADQRGHIQALAVWRFTPRTSAIIRSRRSRPTALVTALSQFSPSMQRRRRRYANMNKRPKLGRSEAPASVCLWVRIAFHRALKSTSAAGEP